MKNVRFYYSTPLNIVSAVALDQNFDLDGVIGVYKSSSRPTPRITICTILNEDRTQLSFGIAVCSKKDRFIKKIGRELAYKAALENPILIADIKNNISETRMFFCEIIEESFWKWVLNNKEGYNIWMYKLKKDLVYHQED